MATKTIAAFALVAALIGAGCAKDKMNDDGMKGDKMQMSSMDACPMCPGVQTATADGKCPECGMPAKTAMKDSSMNKGDMKSGM